MSETSAKRPGRPKGSKNKQIKELQQINGKDESSPKAIPTTLAQIWGDDGTEKYGTLIAEDYEKRINTMSRMDLFTHSAKLSVTPTDNLPMLRKKLMTEFYKHSVKFQPQTQAATTAKKVIKPTATTLQDILDSAEQK